MGQKQAQKLWKNNKIVHDSIQKAIYGLKNGSVPFGYLSQRAPYAKLRFDWTWVQNGAP